MRDALDRVKVGGRLQVPDPLPDSIRREVKLLTLPEAIGQAHTPVPTRRKSKRGADSRSMSSSPSSSSSEWSATTGRSSPVSRCPPSWHRAVVHRITPFELTGGQQSALSEAMADTSSGGKPMNRLLQGDVGSGKTVVALAMMLTAVAGDFQGVMMAPTEVLAEQHFLNVRRLLAGTTPPIDNPDYFAADLQGTQVTVGLLTGSTRTAPRREIQRMAGRRFARHPRGDACAHPAGCRLPNLALAVVDEQHRFGVLQRDALRGKSSVGEPHLLLMSPRPSPARSRSPSSATSIYPPSGNCRKAARRSSPAAEASPRAAMPRRTW